MKLYPLLFEPNLHTVVWGGKRLRPYKGLVPSDEPIGESWEVSAIPSSASVIANGELKGRSIIDVIEVAPDDCRIKIRQTGDEIVLREGNSCLIPAAIADYDVTPLHSKSTLLDAYIDNKDKSLLRRITRFLHITKK